MYKVSRKDLLIKDRDRAIYLMKNWHSLAISLMFYKDEVIHLSPELSIKDYKEGFREVDCLAFKHLLTFLEIIKNIDYMNDFLKSLNFDELNKKEVRAFKSRVKKIENPKLISAKDLSKHYCSYNPMCYNTNEFLTLFGDEFIEFVEKDIATSIKNIIFEYETKVINEFLTEEKRERYILNLKTDILMLLNGNKVEADFIIRVLGLYNRFDTLLKNLSGLEV